MAASISGVALRPGVSRNRRLYSAELINKAAKRMQARLADPNGLPIVMRTHHDAGDDTAKIVGRVTGVSVDNENALRYKGEFVDTFHGQEIAGLVKPVSGEPALRSVSIHGYWLGDTRQVQTETGLADTADDLEIDAIDFTAFPGVVTALIDSPGVGGKATESGGVVRTPISESSEADVVFVDDDTGWADVSHTVPREGVIMARGDVGETRYWVQEAKYSADDMRSLLAKGHAMKNASGEPSYPIADVSDLKKAIRAVGRGKGSHDAIRRHIIKRAKALGQMALIPDNWSSGGSMKESSGVRMSEVTEYFPDGPGGDAGFCIDAYAGPLSVTLRGCVAPDELRFAAIRAATAAMNAVLMMDPDSDGDIEDANDFDDQGKFVGDQDDGMGEQGTGFAGGVVPDDDMRDRSGESAINVKVEGSVLNEKELRGLVQRLVDEHASARVVEGSAVTGVQGKPDAESDGAVTGVEGKPAVEADAGDHAHTHDMTDDTTHTHGHLHTHETDGGGSYDHSHGHTHFHLPGADESHMHSHDHDHSTAPGDTHESALMKESAVSDTKKAAEAAPTRTLTESDLTALGTVIGNSLAEALRAIAEQKDAKHAAATTQETTESAEQVASAESTTQKAEVDVAAMKESLARELRKELRDELRSEFLKENGLPPRRGYRVNESSEEQVELSDAEVFDKHRVEILLGQYASAVAPDATSAA